MSSIPDPEKDFEGAVKGLFDQALGDILAIPVSEREVWLVAQAALRLHRLQRLDAPKLLMEREKRLIQRRAWALPVYCPEFEELTGGDPILNPLFKSCGWSLIEKDSNVYNVGCQQGEEYHLTEGYELYKFCQWCGGQIDVFELDDDDDSCEAGGEHEWQTFREKYGEDADGNRGEWREYEGCAKCKRLKDEL